MSDIPEEGGDEVSDIPEEEGEDEVSDIREEGGTKCRTYRRRGGGAKCRTRGPVRGVTCRHAGGGGEDEVSDTPGEGSDVQTCRRTRVRSRRARSDTVCRASSDREDTCFFRSVLSPSLACFVFRSSQWQFEFTSCVRSLGKTS